MHYAHLLAVLRVAALWLGGNALALAGSFAVNPVTLTLSAERSIDSVVVKNQGTEAAVIQLETLTWAQAQGRDVYTPTRELLATPPIFTIAAGGTQIVRIGLRRPAEPGRELSYRIFFQEVPPPPKSGFQGLRVALRIGVPVFVPPPAAASAVRWQIARTSPKALKVVAVNGGNAHEKILGFKIATAKDGVLAQRPEPFTLLAGQSRQWQIDLGHVFLGTEIRLTAGTAEGEMDAGPIAVQQP